MTQRTTPGFRPVEPQDMPFLAALYASTRQAEMQQSGWPQVQIDDFLHAQFNLQHRYYQQHFPRATFNIILRQQYIVGRLYYQWEGKTLRLIDIALLPEYQKKSIGTQILADFFTEARTRNGDIFLHVELQNPAYRWYETLGFVVCGENGVYQQMRWSAEGTRASHIDQTEASL